MKIEKSREMGFCFGVRRAVDILEQAAGKYGNIETLGPAVHNQQVVESLSRIGVTAARGLVNLRGNVVAISSHGAGPDVIDEIQSRQLQLVDATCPIVHSAQMAAKELSEAGSFVIVFGDAGHPEVRGY